MKNRKGFGKRISAWLLTFVMVLSLVMVPAGKAQAAEESYDLLNGSGALSLSGTATADSSGSVFCEKKFEGLSDKFTISEYNSLVFEAEVTITSLSTGTADIVAYAMDDTYDWKDSGTWNAPVSVGTKTTVRVDLSDMSTLNQVGVRIANCTAGASVSYTIHSAKIVGTKWDVDNENVILSYTHSNPGDSNGEWGYTLYMFTVQNNGATSVTGDLVITFDTARTKNWWTENANISLSSDGKTLTIPNVTVGANSTSTTYQVQLTPTGANITSVTFAGDSISASGTASGDSGSSGGGSGGGNTPTAKSDTTKDLGKNIDYNYAKLLQEALYFYDANMCGPDVETNTGVNWRKACHTNDQSVKYGNYTVDVSGGFHDAGDHDKFGLPQGTSAAILGMGYYEYKDAYTLTGQAEHFKKILNYFCDYFERCTVVDASGNAIAFCYQVGDGASHNLWVSAENENIARPAYFADATTPATDQVSAAAAALAIHYVNFGDEDYLTCAKRLFAMAKKNEKREQDSQGGGFYNSSSWADDYCLAAAWLYKATNDSSYMDEYNKYIGNVEMGAWPSWDQMGPYAAAYGEDKWEAFGGNVTASLGQCQNVDNGYAYLAMWASARYNCNMQLQGLLYDKHNNSDYYTSWAEGQMEFLLGNNNFNTCFVVGYNDLSSKYPHHRSASGYNGVFPDQNGGQVTQAHSLVGALVGGIKEGTYVDTANDYYYNEVALDYNAAFTGAAAALYLKNKDKGNQVIATSNDATLSKVVKTYYGISTVKPTSVTLDATSKELVVGDTFTLKATVAPEDASQNVKWESSDTSVATVNSNGVVMAKASGNATITAITVEKMESGESATATCAVTVKKPAELTSSASTLQCNSLVYGYTDVFVASASVTNVGGVVTKPSSTTLKNGNSFEITAHPTGVQINPTGASTITVRPKKGLAVGTYTDTVVIAYDNKTLEIPVAVTVTKKPITVMAENKTKTYGEVNPALSVDASYEASLVAGDSLSYTLTTTAETNSDAGTYPIQLTVTNHSNYNITAKNGTLTISPKKVSVVNFPTASALKIGQTLEDSTLTGGSTEYGSFAWKDASVAPSKGAPSYAVVLTLNSNAKKNYAFTDVEGYDGATGTITRNVSVNVTRADLPDVIFPTATDITYGQALGASSLVGGGVKVGNTTYPVEGYGTFTWEDAAYVPTVSEIGTIQKYVIFTWSEERKTQYGLDADEMEQKEMVTIKVNKQTNNNVPATPILASRTANRITVSEMDGVEYSKDGVNWQTSGTFEGLSAFTPYKIHARYKETTTQYASATCSTPLQVYTLVANPYTIDVSKLSGNTADVYVDALRVNSNSTPTVTYSNGVLTLATENTAYTLVGSNENIKVCVPNNGTSVALNNATIGQLDVSKNNATSSMSTFVQVNGKSTVSSIISNTVGVVKLIGNGTLIVDYIDVQDDLNITGITIKADATGTGQSAISANFVTIKDSNVTVTGDSGKVAVQAETISITGGEVTATGGAGAAAMEATEGITLENADVKVNAGEGTTDKAIVSDNIVLKGDNNVTTDGGTDDLYSTTPKDENGNAIAAYKVTFMEEDGSTEIDSMEYYAGSSVVLPELEEIDGCVVRWKEKSTGKLYQEGASYTVKGNVTFIVNVVKIKVTHITLDSTAETLEVGDGVALVETVRPANAYDTSVNWSSSDTAVATVDEDGEVTAIAEGTAIITAQAKDGSGVKATCTIKVVSGDVAVEKIKITGETKKVAPGKKLKLTATVYPSNATNQKVRWKVSNKKYATVNSMGVVTTKKSAKGKKITVTAYSEEDDSIKGTYKITVMKNAVKKIKLSAKTKTIKKGKSVTIKAKFTPSKGISKELTWTSSNKKVATVNAKGKVTGKKKGTVKITAKAKDGSGKKATIKIKVK